MPGIGIGIGIGFGRGGTVLQGGTMAAVSSPGVFSAVGGTWTLGDLSPVLWTRAGTGYTVGAEATIPAVTDWITGGVALGTSGGWRTVTNSGTGATTRYIKTNLTGSLTAPARYILDLCRGAPPPGETVNKVRIQGLHAGSDLQVDVDLDAGTLSGSEFDGATIAALGANADAGYRVTITNTAHTDAEEIIAGLLLGDSTTYADDGHVGYFKIVEENDCEQTRAAAWADAGEGEEEWAQTTEANQPLIWTDSRGPCLLCVGAQSMSCQALGAVAGGGTATPVTVAMAFEKDATDATQCPWTFGNSGTAAKFMLVYRNATPRFTLDRISDSSGAVAATSATSLPFAGTVIGRYTGTNVLLRVSGSDVAPVAQTANLTTDRLWLASYDGSVLRLTGRIREWAVWDRSLSDAEAAAVDFHLTQSWGY